MRILVFSNNFPPEYSPGANRTWEHCRRWVRAGADVTVITCTPHYPTGKPPPGYRNRLFQCEEMGGVDVLRVWTFLTPNKGFLRRTLNHLTYAVMAFLAALTQRADVIVATSPHLFVPTSAAAAAFAKRRKWVMEVRDIWPESIVAVGMMRRGRIYRWLERLELKLYRSASRVVILSDAFRAKLVSRGVPDAKIHFVPNGVDRETFFARPPDADLRTRLGLEGKFVLGFIGTLGLAHGLDFILSAAPRLAAEGVAVLFVGDGAVRQVMVDRVRAEGLDNIRIMDAVPRSEVPGFLAAVDCALVNLRRSPTFEIVLPSKVIEAAALERPILLGVRGVAKQLIEQYGAGVVYEPEDMDAFIAATRRLQSSPEFYRRCQGGCRDLAQAFDRDVLAQTMLDDLEALIQP